MMVSSPGSPPGAGDPGAGYAGGNSESTACGMCSSNNVCGGMCFDSSTSSQNMSQTNWSYVGQGRGGYEKMKHYDFVGHGRGSFEKTQVTQFSDWQCRKGCIGLIVAVPLLLTAIALLSLVPHLTHQHAAGPAQTLPGDRYVLTQSYV